MGSVVGSSKRREEEQIAFLVLVHHIISELDTIHHIVSHQQQFLLCIMIPIINFITIICRIICVQLSPPFSQVYFKKTSCKYAKELSLWHRKVFNPRPRRQEWPQTRAYLDQNVDPEAIPEDMISFLSEDAQRWFRKRSPAHLGSSVVHPLLARNTTISSLYEFLRKIMLPVVVAEDHVFLPRLEPAQIDTTHPGMQQ